MKELIKKYLWNNLGLILIIATILIIVLNFDTCQSNWHKMNIKKANSAVLRAAIIDSIQTSNRAANTAYRDSITAVESKKTEIATRLAQKHKARGDYYEKRYGVQKTKADSLVREYRRDTTSKSGKCDEAIAALQTANETLAAENRELDAENEALDTECEGYSNQLYQAREQIKDDTATLNTQKRLISALNAEIEVYKKSQKKAESGFKKAEKWVFAVAGAVITLLITK